MSFWNTPVMTVIHEKNTSICDEKSKRPFLGNLYRSSRLKSTFCVFAKLLYLFNPVHILFNAVFLFPNEQSQFLQHGHFKKYRRIQENYLIGSFVFAAHGSIKVPLKDKEEQRTTFLVTDHDNPWILHVAQKVTNTKIIINRANICNDSTCKGSKSTTGSIDPFTHCWVRFIKATIILTGCCTAVLSNRL